MSDFIVLVKQVPDISQITDNAFNPETGTLVRSRLQNVINDLDTQALAFAHRMRQLSGELDSKIICLTMGPPMADEVLRYSISRCADIGILLTDRALGGADTVATANPLAFAVRRIERDILKGKKDYYIVSGLQSVDGDTAQVPAQLAEELKIGCISYLTEVLYRGNSFEFSRIVSGGNEIVRARSLPIVLTVAKYEYPLFASFAASRKAQQTKLIQWSAADIEATQIGVKGSKTKVTRVFPPGKTTRKCQQVKTVQELASVIVQSCRNLSNSDEDLTNKSRKYVLPGKREHNFDRTFEGLEKENEAFKLLNKAMTDNGVADFYEMNDEIKSCIIESLAPKLGEKPLEEMLEGMKHFETAFSGDVWVIAEQLNGKISDATLELLGKARELAGSLEVKVGAAIMGVGIESLTRELIACGADKVYVVEHPLLADFDPLAHRLALARLIEEFSPQIVLFAATPNGRVLAPMVSYRLGCGLTADCTSLDIRDNTKKGLVGILLQTRPALGGNVMATITTVNSRSQMATARPGVMKKLIRDDLRTGIVVRRDVVISQSELCLEVLEKEGSEGKVNFQAEVIVSGGKGLQNRDNYHALLNSVCFAIRNKLGCEVEKGASRSAVEQGFVERAHQVGQTGTAVGPKLYIALGISGAIQHMIGVAHTETIVAINNDVNAPIFKMCDYFIVGNVEDVLPQLVNELEKRQ